MKLQRQHSVLSKPHSRKKKCCYKHWAPLFGVEALLLICHFNVPSVGGLPGMGPKPPRVGALFHVPHGHKGQYATGEQKWKISSP